MAKAVFIYVGKAKNLRSRAGSYFRKQAASEERTASWIHDIQDIEKLDCESEVDALLVESRLIKDIQPKHNKELKDDKSFPYLQIITGEDFPRVELTRTPEGKGVKLFGPFASAGSLRGAIQVLQRIFKFRTCSLDIADGDERWRWVPTGVFWPASSNAPHPATCEFPKRTTERTFVGYRCSWRVKRHVCSNSCNAKMTEASKEQRYEEAAQLRDELQMLQSLDERGRAGYACTARGFLY